MSVVEGETWYDLPQYQANGFQPDMLAKARKDLADANKQETSGAIVAALTFGYWTAMLGKEYENLWQTVLKDIARREDGKGLRRKDFTKSLGAIRTLRNRLAHHETVLHWDLPKHHRNIMQMITWLSRWLPTGVTPAAGSTLCTHRQASPCFPPRQQSPSRVSLLRRARSMPTPDGKIHRRRHPPLRRRPIRRRRRG